MLKPMVDELQRKSSSCNQGEWYDSDVKEKMVKVSLLHLERIQTVVKSHFADFKETEEEKIRAFSSPKVTFLLGRLMQRAELGDMRYWIVLDVCALSIHHLRCIIFVERKMVAEALARLLKVLKVPGVHGVDFVFSASKGR